MKNIKKYLIGLIVSLAIVGGVYSSVDTEMLGAQPILTSSQVGTSSTDGYVLQTDGFASTWVSTLTLDIAGSQTPWTSDIDGGGYYADNIDYITATGTSATSSFTAISIGTTTHAYALNVDGAIQTDTAFYGDNWISASGNSMAIQPTGDTDDFFSFKTPADRPTIKREGGKYIYIESSNVNDVGISFREDADHSGTINYYKDEDQFGLTSKDPLVFKACEDYDDYITICNATNIPELSVASSSGFKINAGGTNALMLNHDGGNVAIGTTTASSMLTVGATTSSQFLVDSLGHLTFPTASSTAITVSGNSHLTTILGTTATFTSFVGALTGNADTATALETARTIAGVSFDGTANIAIPSTGLSDTADLLYEAELNTFAELQTQIADETLLKAGTLTDTKYCIYDSASTDIICNSSGGSGVALGDSPSWTGAHDWKYAGVPADFQNTTDAVSNQVAIFRAGNRATAADNDQGYLSFYGDNDVGTQEEFGRLTWEMDDVTNDSKDSTLRFWTQTGNTMDSGMYLQGDNLFVKNAINTDSGSGYINSGTSVSAASYMQADDYLNIDGNVAIVKSGIDLKGSSNTETFLSIDDDGDSIATGNSASSQLINGVWTEYSSGNHPLIAGLAIKLQTITAGVATVSDTASLYIEGSATTTVVSGNNYSLWVDDIGGGGKSYIDGTLTLANALPVGSGGTGATTLLDHGVLVGSGTGAITPLAVGTNGQLLIGSTGADPVFATLNCDRSLTCTTGAGTLEVDADAELYTETFTFAVSTSTASVMDNVLQHRLPNDITITDISCWTNTGTTTIQLEERTAPNTSGTDILDVAFSCHDWEYNATTTFANAGITAGNGIAWNFDSQTGSPTEIYTTVEYTIND